MKSHGCLAAIGLGGGQLLNDMYCFGAFSTSISEAQDQSQNQAGSSTYV